VNLAEPYDATWGKVPHEGEEKQAMIERSLYRCGGNGWLAGVIDGLREGWYSRKDAGSG
jgi:hypothetical protein